MVRVRVRVRIRTRTRIRVRVRVRARVRGEGLLSLEKTFLVAVSFLSALPQPSTLDPQP